MEVIKRKCTCLFFSLETIKTIWVSRNKGNIYFLYYLEFFIEHEQLIFETYFVFLNRLKYNIPRKSFRFNTF